MGMLPENNAPVSQDILMVPTPLYYGLGIDWNLLLPLMLVFMITSLETIGTSPPPLMSPSSRYPAPCT